MNMTSWPGAAALTRQWVSQVNSPMALCPVNQAPVLPASAGSSHAPDWHTGLSSPIRVTSLTIAYTSAGAQLMKIESEWWYPERAITRTLGHRPRREQHAYQRLRY